MAEPCPTGKCIDHDNRLKKLEVSMETVKKQLRSPAVTVAVISVIGAVLTACASAAAVIFGPIVRAWLGV